MGVPTGSSICYRVVIILKKSFLVRESEGHHYLRGCIQQLNGHAQVNGWSWYLGGVPKGEQTSNLERATLLLNLACPFSERLQPPSCNRNLQVPFTANSSHNDSSLRSSNAFSWRKYAFFAMSPESCSLSALKAVPRSSFLLFPSFRSGLGASIHTTLGQSSM